MILASAAIQFLYVLVEFIYMNGDLFTNPQTGLFLLFKALLFKWLFSYSLYYSLKHVCYLIPEKGERIYSILKSNAVIFTIWFRN